MVESEPWLKLNRTRGCSCLESNLSDLVGILKWFCLIFKQNTLVYLRKSPDDFIHLRMATTLLGACVRISGGVFKVHSVVVYFFCYTPTRVHVKFEVKKLKNKMLGKKLLKFCPARMKMDSLGQK